MRNLRYTIFDMNPNKLQNVHICASVPLRFSELLSTLCNSLNKEWRIKPVAHVILTSQRIFSDYETYMKIKHFN